jgi:hypothetical protein
MRLQKPVNTGFRDEVTLLVRERHRQLPGREFRLVEGHFQHPVTYLRRDAVPDAARAAAPVFQSRIAKPAIQIVPAIEGRP